MSKATETWTTFAAKAVEFASTGKIEKDDASVINRLVERGNSNPKRQSRCTQSIRTILMDYPGSPFARASALGDAATATLAEAQASLKSIAAAFNKGGVSVQGLLVPHGRSVVKNEAGETVKGEDGKAIPKTHYEDGADFMQTILDGMHDVAVRLQKNGWDGTEDGLQAIIDGGSN
tara:strand:+ start:2002 stop:2529 length:528 start_codon:yes stop_codon:yes gene_type:complete